MLIFSYSPTSDGRSHSEQKVSELRCVMQLATDMWIRS